MKYPLLSRLNLGWLFCGIAITLGWGMRGEIGGSAGAALPGAMLGLGIALVSGRPGWVRAAPVFGMAAALGIAPGGQMSYGLLVGYTTGIDVPNVAYGYAMIGLVGGLWGALGAGCIALVASRVKYKAWQVLAFVVGAVVAGRLLHFLLVDLLNLRANPPRGDSWPEMIGAILALMILAAIRRDPLPSRLVFWGFAVGSVGFMVGDSLQTMPSFISPDTYNWWKLMEQSFGFILGAGIAWAVNRETHGDLDLPPASYPLTVFGVIVTIWWVPMLVFNDMLERRSEVMEELRQQAAPATTTAALAIEEASGFFSPFMIRELVILALIAAVAYALRNRSGKLVAPDFAGKLLFTTVMWFGVLVTAFKMSMRGWIGDYPVIHGGFLVMATVLTIWVWFGFPIRSQAPKPAAPLPLRVIAPIYFAILYPALAFLLAYVSIATHPGEWRGDAHKRFGEEPVTSSAQ